MKKARVINNIVQEIFVVPDGFQFSDCFTPEVVAMFEDVSNEVEVHWVKHLDGSFTAPVAPNIPVDGSFTAPVAPDIPVVTV
jgi:hypothetical protein